MHIYRDLYENVDFLKFKNKKFISWICPMLKTRVAAPREAIFYEGEEQQCVYFLTKGLAEYVLPQYNNQPYIKIVQHTCFGLTDIIVDLMEQPNKHVIEHGLMRHVELDEDEQCSADECFDDGVLFTDDMQLRHNFTVRAGYLDDSGNKMNAIDMLTVHKRDLFRMKVEHNTIFAEFLQSGINELQKLLTIKLYAMDRCSSTFQKWVNSNCQGVVSYDMEILSNNEISRMKYDEVVRITESAMAEAGIDWNAVAEHSKSPISQRHNHK